MRMGVQLYTLRKFLKDPANFDAVFARVAAMGAQCVQVSGTCAFEATMMRSLSAKYDLPVCLTHSPVDRIENDLDRLAEEHLTFGCPEIGIGMMPFKYKRKKLDDIKRFTEFLNMTAERLAPYKLKLGYHNHAFEFKETEGVRIMDYFIENTQKVRFIPDTYWIKVGGFEPEEYLKKLAGRVDVMHFKDYQKGWPLPKIRAVGEGIFDFKSIIETAQQSGATDGVVELDFAKDPYQALEVSMKNLLAIQKQLA